MLARALLALTLASCGASGHGRRPDGPPPEYPGALVAPATLVSPAGLGDAFALEQRVRTEYPEGTQEFRAVLQRTAERMVLVGFGPHGGGGLALTHGGDVGDFESHLPEPLPFPAGVMLPDVQRVWFRGLSGPLPDGEHREERDGEEIVERWGGGRLLERTFRRLDDRPPGVLRARYEGGLGGDAPPPTVEWDNAWFGYRLILTTLSHRRLDAQ